MANLGEGSRGARPGPRSPGVGGMGGSVARTRGALRRKHGQPFVLGPRERRFPCSSQGSRESGQGPAAPPEPLCPSVTTMSCGAHRIAYMFLAEVALGRENHIMADDHTLKQAPPGFDSVVARGRTEPGESQASEAAQAWEGEGAWRPGPRMLSGGGSREGAGEQQASSLQPFLVIQQIIPGYPGGLQRRGVIEHQKMSRWP